MSTSTLVYGDVDGYPEGSKFVDRQAAHDALIHRGLVVGIGAGGSCICMNEGYEDDEDFGDEIIYTGFGGKEGGVQVRDQEYTSGNKSLIESYNQGRPVRVLRGYKLKSAYAPKEGYRYDGLYYIERYQYTVGLAGFKVFRFRLIKQNPGVPVPVVHESRIPKERVRVTSTITRVARDTAVSRRMKALYDYKCQICGKVINTRSGPYAEACHIKPLGRPHDGDDSEDNLLCLCPNCHVEIDRFALTITKDLIVEPLGTELFVKPGHAINIENIEYLASLAG